MITGGFGFTLDIATGLTRKWAMGSDGIKRWADTGELVDSGDIPAHLRKLSEHMTEVATRMDYYGGFNGEMQAKAKELLGAARMAQEWADCIEFEEE